jgi:hypothetical protein
MTSSKSLVGSSLKGTIMRNAPKWEDLPALEYLPGESRQDFALRIGAIFKALNDENEQALQRLEARLRREGCLTPALLTEQNIRDINDLLKGL